MNADKAIELISNFKSCGLGIGTETLNQALDMAMDSLREKAEKEQAIETLTQIRWFADAEEHNKEVKALDIAIETLKEKL
jgi:hypothetical protein